MLRFPTIGFALAFLFTSLNRPSTATAYEWMTTQSGKPISWDSACLHYSIYQDGSQDLPWDVLRDAVRESFDTWEDVPCSHFYFVETDPAEIDEADFYLNQPNNNLLVWRENLEDWDHGGGVIAMTSINFDEKTGRILDADIEFNGVYFDFADEETYPGDTRLMDLRNTLTHEIGHTFGLGHSTDGTATMHDSGTFGETKKQTLEQDDIDGICAIYPLAEDPGFCEEPYCGLGLTADDTECDLDDGSDEDCGCRAIGNRPFFRGIVHFLWLLLR
ncbi:MAG: matrixin family metalloprotease [Myxococcota bacterium]|nr:matrixin family metalloprotease [Myxococcota bacterium]